MPTAEARDKIEKIAKHLELLSQETVDSLVRREDLGSKMSFENLQDEFRGVLQVVQDLASLDLETLPLKTLERLRGVIAGIVTSFERIKKFDQSVQNAGAERETIVSQLVETHWSLVDVSSPIISLGLLRKLKTSETLGALRSELGKAEAARTKVEDVLGSAEVALSKIRGVSGSAGVAAHGSDFSDEAARYGSAARGWMTATLILGALTAVAACLLFHGALSGTDAAWTGGLAVRSIAFRIVLLSFFTYFVAWSARNYRANKHNQVVNTHRKIALSTFETFAKAAEADKDTKNAVLLQATQAIFSAQRSGYLDKEPDASPQSTIVEILRRSQGEK